MRTVLIIFLCILALIVILAGIHSILWSVSKPKIRHTNPNDPLNKMLDVIPKVVYKTGKVSKRPKQILDEDTKFETLNTGWKIQYYSNADGREYIKNTFTEDVLLAYDALRPGAFKADLWRYCIIYERGGVYSDFSQQFKVPIDSIVDVNTDKLLFPYAKVWLAWFSPESVCNGFFCAAPRHPVFLLCIQQIIENVQNDFYGSKLSYDVTGPYMIKKILDEYKFNYRMDLGMNKIKTIDFIKNGKTAIVHKSKNHYKLMGNKNADFGKGSHYVDMWFKRQLYDKQKQKQLRQYLEKNKNKDTVLRADKT